MVRRSFGQVRRLPSGRFQARFRREGAWYTARTVDGGPRTFTTAAQADRWLAAQAEAIAAGTWRPPGKTRTAIVPTFREYAEDWLRDRDLAPTTREHYAQVLRDHVYPAFGDDPLTEITAARVRAWHASVGRPDPRARRKRERKDRPTVRAHAYGLARTIFGDAVADEIIPTNPARIKGAGRAKTRSKLRPATLDELAVIIRETPKRYRMLVQLCVWCSLRFGEAIELRRKDVDLAAGVLRVRRGVVRTKGGRVVKAPKSEAGIRDVTIPSHIVGDLEAHLREHAQPGRDGLLFPGKGGDHLAPASAYAWWYPAREAAGRPDLRIHDLRHTGQTYAALAGANLRELMNRAGQSSPQAALRYIHEASERQREIADNLAALATRTNVVSIEAAKRTRKRKEATK